VVYGGGFTALDKEPTVIQAPDFGERFWVYPRKHIPKRIMRRYPIR
jgi:hypothetical protein